MKRNQIKGIFVVFSIAYVFLLLFAVLNQPNAVELGITSVEKPVPKSDETQAYWSAWIGVFTAIGVLAVVWTLYEAVRTAQATASILELESLPFLSVELLDANNGSLTDRPLYLQVMNEGRSPAKMTKIFRRWHYSDDGSLPPIPEDDIALRELLEENKFATYKTLSIALGAGNRSPKIATNGDWISSTKPADAWLFFDGFVEFSTLDGKKSARTGFCYVCREEFPNRGFHVAFLDDESDRWYYKPEGQGG
jgi:hypothetical protein